MEVFKSIIGYEGIYEVSNFGRIKSLSRKVKAKPNVMALRKEKILTKSINSEGYITTGLSLYGKTKTLKVHRLVYFAFTEKPSKDIKLVINHIDLNKQNNHIDNLELITNAENICHGELNNENNSSKFIGVSFNNIKNKWEAYMSMNRKRKFLGYYENEIGARTARLNYEKENNIKNKYSL